MKTLLSMAVATVCYALYWEWRFALGLTTLILVHEIGHMVAAHRYQLRVSAPVFLPFLGAFINLKEEPPNAWVEAVLGIAGPLFGTMASAVPYFYFVNSGDPFWSELAYWGFAMNLFNLAPVGSLDGGRIVTAVSTWFWVPGYALLIGFAGSRWLPGMDVGAFLNANFVVLLMLFAGLPRLFSLFRPRTEREQRYYAIPSGQRWLMGGLYFGLAGLLFVGMRACRG